MATLNFADRTIELNVAYFGPLQAGCGTNVRHLHRVQPAREKAELRRVGGKDHKERMWYFAYHPADPPKITGFDVKVRLCSIPSGTDLMLDRDAMLAGLDGLVFVCDARAGRSDENQAALLDLEQCLARQGLQIGAVPMVYQVNQSDAQNARPTDRVVEELNPFGFPVFDSMARQGRGVLETHDAILASVLTRVRDNLAGSATAITLTALTRAVRERAEDAVLAHAASLPQSNRQVPDRLSLPASAEIPVRVQELAHSTPLYHLSTEIRADRLRIESVWQRTDGTQRKIAVLLEPADETKPAVKAAEPAPPAPPLPPLMSEDVRGELPRITYGATGLLGGIVAGILLGYIWWG